MALNLHDPKSYLPGATYRLSKKELEVLKTTRTQKWIMTPQAYRVLRTLERLFHHPETTRPLCLLISGDSNNGKTTTVKKFRRDKNPISVKNKGIAKGDRLPVVFVEAPVGGNINSFYGDVLQAARAPYGLHSRQEEKATQTANVLRNRKTRILIIDELHNIDKKAATAAEPFMHELKTLSNKTGVSIVGVGTRDAERIIQLEDQISNRFQIIHMPRWKNDTPYYHFIGRLVITAGLTPHKNIRGKGFVSLVHELTGGLTGETCALVKKMVEHEKNEGNTEINAKTLKIVSGDWISPDERRYPLEE